MEKKPSICSGRLNSDRYSLERGRFCRFMGREWSDKETAGRADRDPNRDPVAEGGGAGSAVPARGRVGQPPPPPPRAVTRRGRPARGSARAADEARAGLITMRMGQAGGAMWQQQFANPPSFCAKSGNISKHLYPKSTTLTPLRAALPGGMLRAMDI